MNTDLKFSIDEAANTVAEQDYDDDVRYISDACDNRITWDEASLTDTAKDLWDQLHKARITDLCGISEMSEEEEEIAKEEYVHKIVALGMYRAGDDF